MHNDAHTSTGPSTLTWLRYTKAYKALARSCDSDAQPVASILGIVCDLHLDGTACQLVDCRILLAGGA